MYLSKIEFSPSYLHKMVGHLRKGLFHEHQVIWNMFPTDKQARRDFLYCRVDLHGDRGGIPFYYLLSHRVPETNQPEFIIQTREFSPKIKQGDTLQFSLRANAVKMVRVSENSKHYKRRSVIEARADHYRRETDDPKKMPSTAFIHHEAGEAWLSKQGERCGFKLKSLLVENHQFHKVIKPKEPEARRFTSIDIKGQLQITSPDLFLEKCFFERDKATHQLIAGLGRSKAFGCGLMLIRRAG